MAGRVPGLAGLGYPQKRGLSSSADQVVPALTHLDPVPRGNRVGVTVVVPTLADDGQSDPPPVPEIVLRRECGAASPVCAEVPYMSPSVTIHGSPYLLA